MFILYTSELFSITENKLVGYADDSTLIATIRKPSDRLGVEASLQRDLLAISSWCDQWCMKLNPNKTKSLVISRSRTVMPPHSQLWLNGVPINECSSLEILGVKFDAKLTFEEHIRSVVKTTTRKIGLMRVARRVYNDVVVLRRCFFSFILPSLEYCSAVWRSSASSHLALLDRVVRNASHLCGVDELVSLPHRRDVAGLCMFYKIYHNHRHPLNSAVCVPPRRSRVTRAQVAAHVFEVDLVRCGTVELQCCFVPALSRL